MAGQTFWQAFGANFGAEKLALGELHLMQGNTPNLITYALPFVAAFTVLEFALGKIFKHELHPCRVERLALGRFRELIGQSFTKI